MMEKTHMNETIMRPNSPPDIVQEKSICKIKVKYSLGKNHREYCLPA